MEPESKPEDTTETKPEITSEDTSPSAADNDEEPVDQEPKTDDQPLKTEENKEAKQKSKSKKRVLLIVLVFILLLGGGAAAWYWQGKQKDKKDNAGQQQNNSNATPQAAENIDQPSVAEVAEASCPEGKKLYENADWQIKFCYPEVWGIPTVADDKIAPADTGSRKLLSFPDKSEVQLGVVSADWSTQVGRGGACYGGTQQPPDFASFSTDWETQGDGMAITYVKRDIEKLDNKYLITESADEFFGGVCVHGYTWVNAPVYAVTTASYFVGFSGGIMTPSAHKDNPNILVPAAERQLFYDFVKSVTRL